MTELLYFCRLARHGGHDAASTGEQYAHRLATAVLASINTLDDAAIDGLIDFIRIAKQSPDSAADLFRGHPSTPVQRKNGRGMQ
ncbi:MAG: hypothetical protein FWD61_11585 [Phycisphaerales bacterium]|nr:hypothetical protein [Phycisphaerales bacterium]